MISLTSHPSPQALARLQHFRDRLAQATAQGKEPPASALNGYRHSDVKLSVLAETSEKCAYCESKVTHVYFGDVEHIRPKDRFPESRLDYDNLTLVCAICNNKKLDYFDAANPIINPYISDPNAHMVALGPLVWKRDADAVGQRTIDLIDLNRVELVQRRRECLERVGALADRFVAASPGPLRVALSEQLRKEAEGSSEYAFVTRAFLRSAYHLDWRIL